MHVRSFAVVTVVGVVIAVGCKGGGGESPDGNFAPGDYESPPGSYDAPGSSWDQPPVGEDTPPSGFDTPPDSGSGSSASTRRVCESICSSLLTNGCAQGNLDRAGCAQGCSEGLTEAYGVCLDEMLGVLDCVLRSPSFNCGLFEEEGEVDEDAFSECEVDGLALSACYEVNPPDLGPDPEPGPDDGFGGEGNF